MRVTVDVSDAAIIRALNTPGGPVYEWRNDREREVLFRAHELSPVNDVLNAQHRGGVVGVFQASWVSRKTGNQHHLGFVVENFADHAIYVEEGRRPSNRYEVFSWVNNDPPGDIQVRPRGTSGYTGHHVLQRAVNSVGASTGDWAPV